MLKFATPLLLLLIFFAIPSAAGVEDPVRLGPGVPIVVGDDEAGPVRRAAGDLQRDLEKVLGERSPILAHPDEAGDGPVIQIVGPETDTTNLPLSDRIAGWESHGVYVREVDGRPTVLLHGADMRGAIYAIYTFSERFLGVKPLWYWAQQAPQPQEAVTIPGSFAEHFDSPQVKWRAWFINDEHRLRPWMEQSPEHVNALGEAMLRLKVNTLETYRIVPHEGIEEPHALNIETDMARRYGLVVSSTHISPFGSVYGDGLNDWTTYWRNIRNQEPPALTLYNQEAMLDFWRYHIETAMRHDLETVWTIAFRGHTDAPFWDTMKDAPQTPEARAEVMEEMWRTQIDLLRETTGDPNPPMRLIFYHELSEMLAEGELELPREPSLIWNFVAARRDHFPAEDVRTMPIPADQLVGYYMNLQFTSTGSHMVAAEGPWKLERNLRTVEALSPTGLTFSVMNAGNVREHLMELSAHAAMAWDFESFDADRFLRRFCAIYFGERHAEEVADLYGRLYNAYWQQRDPDLDGFERQYIFQDLRITRAISLLCDRLNDAPDPQTDLNPFPGGDWFRIEPEDHGADSEVEALAAGLEQSVAELEAVTKEADELVELLPEQARPFFNDNLRVQARFLLHASETTHHLAEALVARSSNELDKVGPHLDQAADAAVAMVEVLKLTRHGPFTDWYAVERNFDFIFRRDQVIATARRWDER